MPTDFYRQMKRQLCSSLSEREAEAVVFWLLEDVAGLTRNDVLMGRADTLSASHKSRLQQMADRISKGEPVQYVLGYADFDNLRIGVAPGVLIPRPETEDMVSMCQTFSPSRILDLCTGSGCIALALKNRFPNAVVEGWDISDKALEIARQNALDLGLDVCFRKTNVLDIPFSSERGEEGEVSLLISNPPYICSNEIAEMERNVLEHEPAEALFIPGDDPFLFYRAIAAWGKSLLCDGGHVMVEINRNYAHEVAELFSNSGYDDVHVWKDRYGNNRVVQATYKHGTNQKRTD